MKRSAIVGLVVGGTAIVVAGAAVAWWLTSGREPADSDPTPSASVSASPTDPADRTAAIQEQLDRYADACAAPAATVPAHCGIVVPWAADLAQLSGVAFRIEAYPVAVVSADGGSFDATGGVLVATATGTTRDGASGSFTYRTDEWALRGDVVVEDGRTIVSVR
ncbi:hypothetical protein [Microbacterium sp. NPDC058389]|uniref:hypothetical protein n=1 Tax=Microbacterium sp. NPDC058389 TaxID=3346475 RepID=UPI0036673265